MFVYQIALIILYRQRGTAYVKFVSRNIQNEVFFKPVVYYDLLDSFQFRRIINNINDILQQWNWV